VFDPSGRLVKESGIVAGLDPQLAEPGLLSLGSFLVDDSVFLGDELGPVRVVRIGEATDGSQQPRGSVAEPAFEVGEDS
jgi:hypothetical protein